MKHFAFGAGEMRQLVHVAEVNPRRAARPFPTFDLPMIRRSLSDDIDFSGASAFHDPDLEIGAWPEQIDQRRLGDFAMLADWHEDDEDDDPATGIDDEPHDALQEDGL